MDIVKRETLKSWAGAQTSLLTDAGGIRYIEKTSAAYPYGADEADIYESLLTPLGIGHAAVVESRRKKAKSILTLEYIDGLICEEKPEAWQLYAAAEKAGALYAQSVRNMHRIAAGAAARHTLTITKLRRYMDDASAFFDTAGLYDVVDGIFSEYNARPVFINHFDMHFKNFIAKDEAIYLIDWASALISPFYCDLYVLLGQAADVDADKNEIADRYRKAAGIQSISAREIAAGGICWTIPNISWLTEMDGKSGAPFLEWAKDLYNDLAGLTDIYKRNGAS